MSVRVCRWSAGLGAGCVFLLATSFAAVPQMYYHDASAKRRDIELELSRGFSSAIIIDLQSPDRHRAARAALALGRTKNSRAITPLMMCFKTAVDPGVRAMAVYGIGLVSDTTRVDVALAASALHDPAAIVRVAGVDAAQRMIAARQSGAVTLRAPLTAHMERDPQPLVRGRAAVALAAYAMTSQAPSPQTRTAGDAVAAAFTRELDANVRAHEAWALGRAFADAPSHAVIVKSLRDPDERVRMAFIDVVARRGAPNLRPLLEALRDDRAWRVAEEAREGLRRLEGRARTEHLTAIPLGVMTPLPEPRDTARALPRPRGLGPLRRPRASDADVSVDLDLTSASALDGPAPGPHPQVRIATSKGDVVLRLYPEWAPVTVAAFLNATERGYYDGLRWFRIVPNFVVQTGDRTNTGDGDPGFTIPAEENPLEQRAGVISLGLNYRGTVPIRDSAGTQFYITLSPQYHLNRAFTVFGEVERGFDVLGRLVESDRIIRVQRLPAG